MVRRSVPWMSGVPLLPGFAPGRFAGEGRRRSLLHGFGAGRGQSVRSGLVTRQVAVRVPRAMFIRKTFGYSSLVLHANTSLVVVADAGHALLPEEPQVVADTLLE